MSGRKKSKIPPKAAQTSPVSGSPDAGGMNVGTNRFALLSRLGVGGMCEVYLARDLRRVECGDSHPLVAVKRLRPELAHDRKASLALAQEFFAMRHLVHPGVARVFDLHRETWGTCFSMELLTGASLQILLGSHPAGLGRAAFPLAGRMLETLNYLHARGVSHGDIKPANIFLEQEGRMVLIDFNAARVDARPGSASNAAARGLHRASPPPAYSLLHASPECLDGSPPSPLSDVFSMCCTVYELLTGEHPFKMLPANVAYEKGFAPAKPTCLSGREWRRLGLGLAFDPLHRPNPDRLLAIFNPCSWSTALSRALIRIQA